MFADAQSAPPVVSAIEAAAKLGVSRMTVIRRIQSGALIGHKLGRDWFVSNESLAEALS